MKANISKVETCFKHRKIDPFTPRVKPRVNKCLWMKLQCVTIQMKAIEQCFHVMLFVFDNFAKLNSRFLPLVLSLALLGVKGLKGITFVFPAKSKNPTLATCM